MFAIIKFTLAMKSQLLIIHIALMGMMPTPQVWAKSLMGIIFL